MNDEPKEVSVIGYCRVSTTRQDVDRQRAAILEFANSKNWHVDRIVTAKSSTRKDEAKRGIDQLRTLVQDGQADVVIFAELSRLARSVGQIARLVDEFAEAGVELHFIKENLVIGNGKRSIAAKVTMTMFALLAEIERDLISERTTDGLAFRKAQGVRLGRPAGKTKLDPFEAEIKELDQVYKTPQRAIARRYNCSAPTVNAWLKKKRVEWRKSKQSKS